MEIALTNIAKRYNYSWIFKGVNLHLKPGSTCAIVGHNGSGKSTLLQIIAGILTPSKGDVQFLINKASVQPYQHISIAAPYMELIEEMTFKEVYNFQQGFKKFRLSFEQCEALFNFKGIKHKTINQYSSGMKQRLMLLLAVAADSSVLLLDEPTANFDDEGVKWYHKLIDKNANGRTIVVSSNHKDEYMFCEEIVDITNFK